MQKGNIRLCYKKTIANDAQAEWEKAIFNDTYIELQTQARLYDPEKKHPEFGELLLNVPVAEKLHFLVSSAAVAHIRALNGIVPEVFNNLGNLFLPFKNYRFHIIASNIQNRALHQVAIYFFSKPLVWHDTVNDHLLVSIKNDNTEAEGFMTEMVPLKQFLSIHSFKPNM